MRIKRLREARGISQRELARRAGITQAYISLLEAGKHTNISVAVAKKLAKALRVPVTEMLR